MDSTFDKYEKRGYEEGLITGSIYVYRTYTDMTVEQISQKMKLPVKTVEEVIESPFFKKEKPTELPKENVSMKTVFDIAENRYFEKGRTDGMIQTFYVDMGVNNAMRVAVLARSEITYVRHKMDEIYGDWLRRQESSEQGDEEKQ